MPTSYNEVFVFVAGSTPQIITETLYALAHQSPSIHSHEIHIITTTTGRDRIYKELVEKGYLRKLCEEYELPMLRLLDNSFHVPVASDGRELDDIRTPADNIIMGDLISDLIREISSNPTNRLHCSLAGGRKTMSFYLGTALMLFGRQWDRLYHVLVSPELEGNPEFFYKPKISQAIPIRLPDGNRGEFPSEKAEIEIAELPFIRLRNKVSVNGKSFTEMVCESQRVIDSAAMQPLLTIDLESNVVSIGDKLIEFTPTQLAVYVAFLRQKTDHCRYIERQCCLECTACFESISAYLTSEAWERISTDYRKIQARNRAADDLIERWQKARLDEAGFRTIISRIKSTLREQLNDEALATFYVIGSMKRWQRGGAYGIKVDKRRIRIVQ